MTVELGGVGADVQLPWRDTTDRLHDEHIESLNMTLWKVSKNRPLFPNDEAAFKLLYLALRNISKRWTLPIKNWSGAMNQLAILIEPDRWQSAYGWPQLKLTFTDRLELLHLAATVCYYKPCRISDNYRTWMSHYSQVV